ncbi:lipase maturation factor 1 isoform X3 [Monodon monoceros]|uniref:lipase maturation factor 1 isoform X3 n=1 Tax=Monodon monoceros TaxID=40151 RepID=UPI0010F5DE4E|nr:lipase maturation factor 1 isoform X3 [Monodon monoceros]
MRSDGPAMAAPEDPLRKRKAGVVGPAPESPPGPGRDPAGCPARLRAGTFWLTRIMLLKALAFVYFVAFLVAFHQNKQLIGDTGLLPCRVYLRSVQQHFRGQVSWETVSYAPTVLWLLDWSHMDFNLDALALLGLGISSFILVSGCANMVLMAALWVLYMSLVNVGQIWYSFGWESQLLETGFLGIFLCPLWTLSPLPRGTPTSRIVLWGYRWLIFRIMLGAASHEVRHSRRSIRRWLTFLSVSSAGPDQDPGGPVLAGPHLHGLPLRGERRGCAAMWGHRCRLGLFPCESPRGCLAAWCQLIHICPACLSLPVFLTWGPAFLLGLGRHLSSRMSSSFPSPGQRAAVSSLLGSHLGSWRGPAGRRAPCRHFSPACVLNPPGAGARRPTLHPDNCLSRPVNQHQGALPLACLIHLPVSATSGSRVEVWGLSPAEIPGGTKQGPKVSWAGDPTHPWPLGSQPTGAWLSRLGVSRTGGRWGGRGTNRRAFRSASALSLRSLLAASQALSAPGERRRSPGGWGTSAGL